MAISKIYQFRVKNSITISPIFSHFLPFSVLNAEISSHFVTLSNQFGFCKSVRSVLLHFWAIFDSIWNAQILIEIGRFSTRRLLKFRAITTLFRLRTNFGFKTRPDQFWHIFEPFSLVRKAFFDNFGLFLLQTTLFSLARPIFNYFLD